MRHEIELRVQVQQPNDSVPQWYPLDIGSGNTLTLDYVSNLLSGVSKITSSRSFTAKLPRTRRNDTVLDLAVVPQHQSIRPYRYLPCRVYADGIDVCGEAYMYLVSAEAATYSAVITFGLMMEYKNWVDAGLSLRDLLDQGQYIRWNSDAAYGRWVGALQPVYEPPLWYGNDANVNTYTPANGLGRLMYYGIYNPGFERDDVNVDYANVHPFVTVRELWERIVSENGLNFRLAESVKLDMENLAVVLTKVSGNDPQGNPYTDNNEATGYPETLRLSSALSFGWNIICTTLGDCFENGNAAASRKGKILYKGDGNSVSVMVNMLVEDNSSFSYNGSNRSASYILDDVGHIEYFDLCIYVYSIQQTLRLTPTFTGTGLQWSGTLIVPCYGTLVEGDAIADIWIENDTKMLSYLPGALEQYWMLGRDAWDRLFPWQRGDISVIYYQGTHVYPSPAFRFVSNLPDIKQLDFVKMVCNLYGLFASQTPSGIDFIEIDKLEENKEYAYDWSRYLLEDDPDAPHHTDWHMTDLARRNRASYKEDYKDLVVDEAFLDIDDDTLDPLKDFFTIPLAAAEGDTIHQYEIIQEGDDQQHITYKAEFTECEHRLMRVVEWYNYNDKTVTRLAFQNLSTAQILAERYSSYRAYVNQPRIVTERLRVPLADLRALDYSRPVFLSKYGRHFAIIDIKWTVTQDTCEAKLLMLAEAASGVSPVPPTPTPTLEKIEAAFNAGGNTIYDNMSVDDLKQYLTVVAFYSDNTQQTLSSNDYTLSGSLVAPSSTITVSYEGETATFTVAVAHVYPYDALVEYLESDGTQYINLGITPAANEVIKIKFKRVSGTGFAVYIGSRGGVGDRQCYIGQYNGKFVASIGTTNSTALGNYDTNGHTITMNTATGLVSIDGGTGVNCGSFVASSFDICLFALNTNGTIGNNSKIQVMEVEIGTRMSLRPCRKNGVGYMYDAVSDSLLTNNGTFAYGNDI